ERPSIPGSRFAERLERAVAATDTAGLAATLVSVGSDLRYLTGYAALPLERLTLLVLRPRSRPAIIVPRLELGAARAGLRTDIEIRPWDETDDPYALALAGIPGTGRIAVSDTMLAMHLLRIQAALGGGATYVPASTVLGDLRMIKDDDEIALLRAAAHAADRVVGAIAGGRLVGRTEADVAREVRERLVDEGHETATFAIVASGPNSASPHHEASERVIRAGEPIVLDIGGTLGGYGSDITRTLWVTGGDDAKRPDVRFAELFAVLQAAQVSATRAVRPGVACAAIDEAARSVIEAAGHGPAFFHRTGHGIGLDGHEDPYLVEGNPLPLQQGMAFSVEPGIYYPGEYGARIEDIVVCGEAGPVVLNEAPRELAVVDG
ncbi:MAG TPA: Xaa-Pro peptidase family protein, partial [Candidatus Limnocylindrales bacterium]|nr:Xaa-Pro peptidase family protein [Candidatus Limnocylindrales bacterium]